MRVFRVGMMLAALLSSAVSVHAMSPSVASLQALRSASRDQAEACPQMLRLFAFCEGACPAPATCPVLNASTCWFTQAVQQGMTGWQCLRTMCAASGECCKEGAMCGTKECCKDGCVSGAPEPTRQGHTVVLTLDRPVSQLSDLAKCKVIKIEFQNEGCQANAGCGTCCNNGRVGSIILRGQPVTAPASCCSTAPASCCCDKECACCESCKQKKTAATRQAPCCPLARCLTPDLNVKVESCCEPATPVVRGAWTPILPTPAFIPAPPPAPAHSYAVPMNGASSPRVIALALVSEPRITPTRTIISQQTYGPTMIELPLSSTTLLNSVKIAAWNAVNAYPTVKRAHLVTPDMEADCDRMTHHGDLVVLEGNVQLVSKRNGSHVRIEAHRVVLNMKNGTFTVESDAAPVRPSTFGMLHAPSFPANGNVSYEMWPVSTYQPPTYRFIEMGPTSVPDLIIPDLRGVPNDIGLNTFR